MFSPEMHITIIGSGKMGTDIFQFLTGFNFTLSVVCGNDELSAEMKDSFEKKIYRMIRNGILSNSEARLRLKNTRFGSKLELVENADLVMEAIYEDMALKQGLFDAMRELLKPGCLVVSNTSSILPSVLFRDMKKKENCAGLHFFYPVRLKRLVEINAAEFTSDKTVMFLKQFIRHTGKQSITLKEPHVFIINKLMLGMQAEAFNILEEGLMSMEEIDALVNEHLFPGGIFLFFDQVGLDVMYAAVRNYTSALQEYPECSGMLSFFSKNIENGFLGVKSGKGCYNHGSGKIVPAEFGPLKSEVHIHCYHRMNEKLMNSFHDAVKRKTISPEEVALIAEEFQIPFPKSVL